MSTLIFVFFKKLTQTYSKHNLDPKLQIYFMDNAKEHQSSD